MKTKTLNLISRINDKLRLVEDSDLHYNDTQFVEHVRCVENFEWFNRTFDKNDFFEFEFRNHLLTVFILKLNKYIDEHRSEVLTSEVFKDIIELTRTVDYNTDDYFEYKLQNVIQLHWCTQEELSYISKRNNKLHESDVVVKEVVCQFLYSKIEEVNAVDEDGNVEEQEVITLGNDHQITVGEAYRIISILED